MRTSSDLSLWNRIVSDILLVVPIPLKGTVTSFDQTSEHVLTCFDRDLSSSTALPDIIGETVFESENHVILGHMGSIRCRFRQLVFGPLDSDLDGCVDSAFPPSLEDLL